MSHLTADDTSALIRLLAQLARQRAAGLPLILNLTGPFEDGAWSAGLHRPDALHSRALAHGVGPTIGDAVRAALEEATSHAS